jgi:hypothetical protein
MFIKIRFHKPHSTANVVVTHETRSSCSSDETRKEQQSATMDLKSRISIVHGQHDNIMGNCGEAAISKPLFTLTHDIPRVVLAHSVPW